jgi:uncharacterized protein (TIGR02996 family)
MWREGAMDVEAALFQAIHDDPTDEAAYLALADWLEEQGRSERSELLRLQRELRWAPQGRREREARVQALLAGGAQPCVPTLTNSIGIRLALISPGFFWMGSPWREDGRQECEGPRHKVEITRPFYLGVFPVTQEQYQRVVGHNPSFFSAGGGAERVAGIDTRDFPVETVSWEDARVFCATLARSESGRIYRLPTEAEWEYACRADACNTPFAFGEDITPALANVEGRYAERAWKGPYSVGRPTPVGSYRPNAFGLYDMHGNVFEWCADWFSLTSYLTKEARDPQGPTRGTQRVVRGGSWNNPAYVSRSADRNRDEPEERYHNYGFRVVMQRP